MEQAVAGALVKGVADALDRRRVEVVFRLVGELESQLTVRREHQRVRKRGHTTFSDVTPIHDVAECDMTLSAGERQ